MRLNSIKLSGFKSFAEPTHFQLPGQLVGVVGPNGCGKSNIMDAVRWVLGESKASELRGESMQDVIFNGSGQRKPAGRASVELAFSNEDARAGGQWNQFAEIAVKRVLTRDGTSSYYINNQPVRRRDVQDVFLGTGLGPRAYAIIGQGTISRIIESRPEELRLFLEEAAGVSRYKERRRETEQRLRDARENLTRVDDILRELDSHLGRLESQAAVAGRYREMQAHATLKLHQLWFLKHRDASAEQRRVQAAVLEAANALEAGTAELRRVEAEIESVRQSHYAASDALHAAQGELAEAALEVSRLEERIRYVVEGRKRTEQRLAEQRLQTAQWRGRREQAEREFDEVGSRIAAAQAEVAALAGQEQAQGAELPACDNALRAAQAERLAERSRVAEVQQRIQVLAAESRSVDEQLRRLQTRDERLAGEQQGLVVPDASRLLDARDQSCRAAEAQLLADAWLHELGEQVPALDEQRRSLHVRLAAETAQQTSLHARLQALRSLQERVQTEGRLRPWLAKHGMEGLAGIWTRIEVEPGWEPALESALRERLGALEVGRLDSLHALAADPPPAKLAFYTPPAARVAGALPEQRGLKRLADWLRIGNEEDRVGLRWLFDDWLAGVYAADRLDDALAARERLAHGETIVTREGHAVSACAVSFYAPDSEQSGLLARAQEIVQLDRQLRAQTLIADESRSAAVRADAAYSEAAQHLATARRDVVEAQKRAHSLQVALLQLSQQAEQSRAREAQLDADRVELSVQRDEFDSRRILSEAQFEALDIELAAVQERHAVADDAVIGAERRLAEAREAQRLFERRAQEARFAAQALGARRDELQRAIATAVDQLAAHATTAAELEAELERLADESDDDALQAALGIRVEREAQLSDRRHAYDDLSLRLRRADERRMAQEHSLQPMREQMGRLQLEEQAAQLGGAQYLEQLQAAEVDLAALAATVDEGRVRLAGLQAEIDRVNREIAALGAVNLAALDELGAERERKGFLDAQYADLREAIATLEGAIHQIDVETRGLLAATFEQVNAHFGRMFPSLFGGGTARLVMTGDEILDAGVQVMAQPPGKKNSTIHLLSGGEKALTAIALVFAIFQLNPAPFCLLDEVDAPLDDANTERYARLVRQMSEATQFLFISHNKIAMEMAQQLIGVTMQEQGVSRIVAVDVAAAVGLAEAA